MLRKDTKLLFRFQVFLFTYDLLLLTTDFKIKTNGMMITERTKAVTIGPNNLNRNKST